MPLLTVLRAIESAVAALGGAVDRPLLTRRALVKLALLPVVSPSRPAAPLGPLGPYLAGTVSANLLAADIARRPLLDAALLTFGSLLIALGRSVDSGLGPACIAALNGPIPLDALTSLALFGALVGTRPVDALAARLLSCLLTLLNARLPLTRAISALCTLLPLHTLRPFGPGLAPLRAFGPLRARLSAFRALGPFRPCLTALRTLWPFGPCFTAFCTLRPFRTFPALLGAWALRPPFGAIALALGALLLPFRARFAATATVATALRIGESGGRRGRGHENDCQCLVHRVDS